MKQNAAKQIVLTNHAFVRYCERVGTVTWEQLSDLCKNKFENRQFVKRGKRYIRFDDDTWWAYITNSRGIMNLVTCYGKSTFDVPTAIRWASEHNDFIRLSRSDEDAGQAAETLQ